MFAVALLTGCDKKADPISTAAVADKQAGILAATRYFHLYELPKVGPWLEVVASREAVCREMQPEWF